MELAQNIYLEKILEYDDLFLDESFDIDTVLCNYSRELIVKAVNCLALTYEKAYIPSSNPFFSELTPKVRDLTYRFEQFRIRTKQDKICYCTQRTILELLRRTFAIPYESYLNNSEELIDFEYNLFKVLLKINQQLMSFKSESKNEDITTLTFLLNFVLNDVTNADWKSTFQTQIYYFDNLYFFLQSSSAGKFLLEKLCQQLGVESIIEYKQTIFALISLYMDIKRKNPRVCPILDLSAIDDLAGFLHENICDYLSLDIKRNISYGEIDNSRENNVDYREFRSHPLVKISDHTYIIYNLPLLCERLYNSLFFDLKMLYKGDFFSYYNKEFIEHSLFHRSMLSCLGKHTTTFFPSKESIMSIVPLPEKACDPDFYIREKDSIILFECKGIKINGQIKDKADIDEFINVLKNKLYLSSTNIDPNRRSKTKAEFVGISQLVNTIELIEDDEFNYDTQIPMEISYYSVIIFEDPKLSQIGMMGLLNNWYKQLLLMRNLSEQVCNPIITMSISTLYLFSDKFRIFGFQNIFDEFIQKNTDISGKISPFADFDWYMRQRYQISVHIKNDFLKQTQMLRSYNHSKYVS